MCSKTGANKKVCLILDLALKGLRKGSFLEMVWRKRATWAGPEVTKESYWAQKTKKWAHPEYPVFNHYSTMLYLVWLLPSKTLSEASQAKVLVNGQLFSLPCDWPSFL